MIKVIAILVLILAFPAGYLLAYLCRDELVSGRKWFILLAVLSLVTALIIAFISFNEKIAVILSLFFIAIVSFISVWKSYDKKFVR